MNEPCVVDSNIVELEDACFAWKKVLLIFLMEITCIL